MSPQLFRQMSGRAGRRGFDKSGQVVFYGLSFDRISLLTTSNVASLTGHQALPGTTLLRLLHRMFASPVGVDQRSVRGMLRTMIGVPLMAHTWNRLAGHDPALSQMGRRTGSVALTQLTATERRHALALRRFTADATASTLRFLASQRLVDAATLRPTRLALLPILLPETGSSAFLFLHLLRSGALHALCEGVTSRNVTDTAFERAVERMLALLARLFSRLPLSADAAARLREEAAAAGEPVPATVMLPAAEEVVLKQVRAFEATCRLHARTFLRVHSAHALDGHEEGEGDAEEDGETGGVEDGEVEAKAAEEAKAAADKAAAGVAAGRRGRGSDEEDEEDEDSDMDIADVGGSGAAGEEVKDEEAAAREARERAVAEEKAAALAAEHQGVVRDSSTLPVSALSLRSGAAESDAVSVASVLRSAAAASGPGTVGASAGGGHAAELAAFVQPVHAEAADRTMSSYLSLMREDMPLEAGMSLPVVDSGEFARPLSGYVVCVYRHASNKRLRETSRVYHDVFNEILAFRHVLSTMVKFVLVHVLKVNDPVRVVIEEIEAQFKQSSNRYVEDQVKA